MSRTKDKRKLNRELKMKRKATKAELKALQQQMRKEKQAEANKHKQIARQLKLRDKELTNRFGKARLVRSEAKDTCAFIGYTNMFADGICEVEEGLFSQTIAFPDISYQSAREDRQTEIWVVMQELIDYFGADSAIQFNVINTPIDEKIIGNRNFFNPNALSCERSAKDACIFNDILNKKMKEGISNIKRDRYITYSVAAKDLSAAVPALARQRTAILNTLAKIGCTGHVLNGTERLELLHSQLNPTEEFNFDFERDIRPNTGLHTKDFVSPIMLDFKAAGTERFFNGHIYGSVLVIRSFGSDLSDAALSDIVTLPFPLNVSWHLQPMDKSKAINYVNNQNIWIQSEIIEEQRRAVSKGYDFTILPPELAMQKAQAEAVLQDLEHDQHLYTFSGVIYTWAKTQHELNEQLEEIISVARVHSLGVESYNYLQPQGINTMLPLGHNHSTVERKLTSAPAAMLIPFATLEIDDEGGNYVGQNKDSNNLVIVNRKKLSSTAGFVCGKPGSGKSFFVKQEVEGTILNNPKDQVIIFDRAGEYNLLTKHHEGTEMRFAIGSEARVNPFDMATLTSLSVDAQIGFKVDAMLAQAAASAAEAGTSLAQTEQSIISRAVEWAFRHYTQDPTPENIPLLQDFYEALLDPNVCPEPEARTIALRYERFVTGSMDFFNYKTNVDWNCRIIDINLKELPDSMLVFALINMCEATRNQMYRNFDKGIRTWIYVEEIQSLFKYPTVLNYFSRFAKEARKSGGIITGITQNSIAMLEQEEARDLVLNSDFIMLLKQSPTDRATWCDFLQLSAQEVACVDETCERGNGLLICGAARVPIVGGFPKDNELYELFSTDPNEQEERLIQEALRVNEQKQGINDQAELKTGVCKNLTSSNDAQATKTQLDEQVSVQKEIQAHTENKAPIVTLCDADELESKESTQDELYSGVIEGEVKTIETSCEGKSSEAPAELKPSIPGTTKDTNSSLKDAFENLDAKAQQEFILACLERLEKSSN